MSEPCPDNTAPASPDIFPPETTHRNRRQFLELAGIAVASLAAIPVIDHLESAFSAFLSRHGTFYTAKSFGLPVEAEAYMKFYQSFQFQHINLDNLATAHFRIRNNIRNSLPPMELWSNLRPTLQVVEKLAEKLGEKKPKVISAYRTPAYNSRCPGAASNSQHLQNRALDLVFTAKPAVVAETARELRSKGLFRGGVGLYPNFVHIDTRGHNADW